MDNAVQLGLSSARPALEGRRFAHADWNDSLLIEPNSGEHLQDRRANRPGMLPAASARLRTRLAANLDRLGLTRRAPAGLHGRPRAGMIRTDRLRSRCPGVRL